MPFSVLDIHPPSVYMWTPCSQKDEKNTAGPLAAEKTDHPNMLLLASGLTTQMGNRRVLLLFPQIVLMVQLFGSLSWGQHRALKRWENLYHGQQ